MKKPFFIQAFLFVFALAINGQTTKADVDQLRKEINLPALASIYESDEADFPASKPIKIYPAIKHSKSEAKRFAKWVEKWNEENAARFGKIQIVDKLEDADIAAVQYQYGAGRYVREDSIGIATKPGRSGGVFDKDDKIVLGRIGNSKVKAESAAVNLRFPLYSYLLVREADSSWIIDYSRVDERISNDVPPELLLQSEIESRLKNR